MTGSSRHVRRIAGIAVATLLAGVALGSVQQRAVADSPLDQARAEATKLAAQVKQLQNQEESASEAYDRASGELADAVANRLQAADAASAAARKAATDSALAGAQARALYQSGGPLALYAGALDSGDFGSFADRMDSVRRLAAQDDAITTAAGQSASAASDQADALASAEDDQAKLQEAAAKQAATVRNLLSEQSALLDQVNDQVKALVVQQQQEEAAAAQAAFQAQLRDAYAAAGVPLTFTATTDTKAANALAGRAVAAMEALVAVHPPYVWGGTGPNGYDCSGLTGAAYAAAGLNLPRTAAQQYLSGPHPALTDLKPGDLLFWADNVDDPSTIHHVAMYAGGNLMWSTDHTGDVARLQPIWGDGFLGATRPDPGLAAAVTGPRWSAGA